MQRFSFFFYFLFNFLFGFFDLFGLKFSFVWIGLTRNKFYFYYFSEFKAHWYIKIINKFFHILIIKKL